MNPHLKVGDDVYIHGCQMGCMCLCMCEYVCGFSYKLKLCNLRMLLNTMAMKDVPWLLKSKALRTGIM